jgi:hypothetical protein
VSKDGAEPDVKVTGAGIERLTVKGAPGVNARKSWSQSKQMSPEEENAFTLGCEPFLDPTR